jgi:hypothetical protein
VSLDHRVLVLSTANFTNIQFLQFILDGYGELQWGGTLCLPSTAWSTHAMQFMRSTCGTYAHIWWCAIAFGLSSCTIQAHGIISHLTLQCWRHHAGIPYDVVLMSPPVDPNTFLFKPDGSPKYRWGCVGYLVGRQHQAWSKST